MSKCSLSAWKYGTNVSKFPYMNMEKVLGRKNNSTIGQECCAKRSYTHPRNAYILVQKTN